MTTYTAITDTETGFEKPVTISLMRRLRDNPLAIQEGDATAPNLLLGVAAKTALGGVGTLAWLNLFPTGGITAGTTYAGSDLRYSGVSSASGAPPYSLEGATTGATPAGTWRALGHAPAGNYRATLFMRIS